MSMQWEKTSATSDWRAINPFPPVHNHLDYYQGSHEHEKHICRATCQSNRLHHPQRAHFPPLEYRRANHRAVALHACGRVFRASCMAQRTSQSPTPTPACPMCRENLYADDGYLPAGCKPVYRLLRSVVEDGPAGVGREVGMSLVMGPAANMMGDEGLTELV
jgi:hypothetical protein